MRTCIGFCLALALLVVACGRSDRREYRLQGQVLSVAAERKEATIKHEDIKGFMPAVTMPYKVRDESLPSLGPGDLITATLVMIRNDAYLENVKKVGHAPVEKAPGQPGASASSGFELLKVGQPVPAVHFTDQDGRSLEFGSLNGSAVVVTFTYTTCPMPTFCPLMDRHFVTMQAKLDENRNALNVRLLSVSLDPLTDTPPVLKKHAQGLGADPAIWTFVTGDRDAIEQWAARFGVSATRVIDNPRDITHNLRTAIIDRQGNLVQTYTGNEWTPEQVLADVRVMVGVD